MTDKVTLNNLAIFDPTVLTTVNNNNAAITTAVDKTLSRDGSIPNQMEAPLDMNSNHILNLPAPLNANEPLRLQELINFSGGSGIVGPQGPPGTGAQLSTTNIWTANQYFKNGDPWADVKAFGAVGNSVTDDTAAFTAAINFMSSTYGGGIVYVPPGYYILKTGITIPNWIRLVGAGASVTTLSDGGNNTNPTITITGHRVHLENMMIFGCGRAITADPLPSFPAVSITNNGQDGVRCIDCMFFYGSSNVVVASQDVVFDNCSFSLSYGGSGFININTQGQVWAHRCILDQGWPVALPGYGTTITNWAPNTVYSVGQVVLNGAYYMQCSAVTSDFKSGSVAPTIATYVTPMVDNHVTWLLVNNASSCAVLVSSGENYFNQCDFSGDYVYGIRTVNTGSLTISVHNSIFGQHISNGIYYNGTGNTTAFVNNCQVGGGWSSGFAIQVAPAAIVDLSVQGCYISGANVGVHMDSLSSSYIINGNFIGGSAGAGVFAAPGVSNFIITNNNLGAPPALGANLSAVTVASGTSNRYIIANNIVNGAGSGVTDGGSGVNKIITGNI